MHHNSRALRRVGAAAAVTTLAALVPVGLAASPAFAAATGLSVSSTTANADASGTGGTTTAQITVTLTGVTGPTEVRATTGTNNLVGNTDCGSAVPAAGSTTATTTCNLTSAVAGAQSYTIFADNNGDTLLTSGEPSKAVTVTYAGTANSVAVTPTTAHAAANTISPTFTATLVDTAGNPRVNDASLHVTASEPTPTGGSAPTVAIADSTGTSASGPSTATLALQPTSATGAATFVLASDTPGALSFRVFSGAAPFTAGDPTATGTLTVDQGGAEAAKSLVVAPTSQNAFTNGSVSEVATVTNAQGDLLGGVPVTFTVSGAQTLTGQSAVTTNSSGQATITFTGGPTAGTDTFTAFVNQSSGGTAGPDPNEPQATATVTLAAEPTGTTLTPGNAQTVQTTSASSVPLTATVTSGGIANTPLVGYVVTFALPAGTPSTESLSATQATTNSSGVATVNILNSAAPPAGSVSVTETLAADTTKTGMQTVTFAAPGSSPTLTVAPAAQTLPDGSQASVTATLVDQFNNPIVGDTVTFNVSGRNSASNNIGTTGTGTTNAQGQATFSYTDNQSATTDGTDTVTASASSPTGNFAASGSSKVFFVTGTAKVSQLNIDLIGANGDYESNNATPPVNNVPKNFDTNAIRSTSTMSGGDSDAVEIAVIDVNGQPLANKAIAVTTSGNAAQVFTTSAETTAVGATVATNANGVATVFVRSATSGTTTINATADGVSNNATIQFTGQYVGLTPKRILDTRTGLGQGTAPQRVTAGQTVQFNVGGTGTIPDYASAVAINVTAVNPDAQGNLRVFPEFNDNNQANSVPNTATVNYQPGQATNNFAIVALSDSEFEGGNQVISLFSDGANTDVVIDIVGYYTTGYVSVGPNRLADTRTTSTPLAANTVRSFQVAGQDGVPANASAVAINVTPIAPAGPGNLRVFPDNGSGTTAPNAATTSYLPGQTRGAFTLVKLPSDGLIDLYSDGQTVDATIDVVGYIPAANDKANDFGPAGATTLLTPTRVLDTRAGSGNTGGITGPIPANTEESFTVAGQAGVPANAADVILNVFAAGPTSGNGNLRVYPDDATTPTVATINYIGQNTIGNTVIVRVPADGKIKVYSDGSATQVIADVVGYIPLGAQSNTGGGS